MKQKYIENKDTSQTRQGSFMHLIDHIVIIDPDGNYFLGALRTAISLTLGILVYLYLLPSPWSGYSILMSLFAVQVITGGTAIRRVISGIITTFTIAIIILFSSISWVIPIIILQALLAGLTLYGFWYDRNYGMLFLLCVIFSVISFSQHHSISTQLDINPIFYGGLCATLTHLLVPQKTMRWYQRKLLSIIFAQLSDTFLWLTQLPVVPNFDELSLQQKNIIFKLHTLLQKLLATHKKNKQPPFYHQAKIHHFLYHTSKLLMDVSYWPTGLLDNKDINLINELRQETFLYYAIAFQQLHFLSLPEADRQLVYIRKGLDGLRLIQSHPNVMFFISILYEMAENTQKIITLLRSQ